MAFLDKSGVERLWLHIISKLNGKVDTVDGKGLSTNDYTTEEKEQLATLSALVGDTAAARENLLIVVSATEPASPETGMLWFDIS